MENLLVPPPPGPNNRSLWGEMSFTCWSPSHYCLCSVLVAVISINVHILSCQFDWCLKPLRAPFLFLCLSLSLSVCVCVCVCLSLFSFSFSDRSVFVCFFVLFFCSNCWSLHFMVEDSFCLNNISIMHFCWFEIYLSSFCTRIWASNSFMKSGNISQFLPKCLGYDWHGKSVELLQWSQILLLKFLHP